MRSRQKAYDYIALVCFVLFFTSCGFNGMYLHPTKVPEGAKGMTLETGKDTTIVLFSETEHAPTFINNKKDTLDRGFDIEGVVFKNAKGLKLSGWFLKSKKQPATTTLLHLHGNAGFLLSHYETMVPLLDYGFQIFMFDYSGFGFSEGQALRENVLDDALSAFDYIKSREDVKNSNLVIYGQSFGGHLSTIVATQRQNELDALVVEGAFSSHKDIAAYRFPFFGRLLVKEMYSATKTIKEFRKPVLVIHSTEDDIVPFFMGRRIYDNANEPKQFYEVRKCHICAPKFYADSIANKIKSMLTQKSADIRSH